MPDVLMNKTVLNKKYCKHLKCSKVGTTTDNNRELMFTLYRTYIYTLEDDTVDVYT
jgi:hypothetical protein